MEKSQKLSQIRIPRLYKAPISEFKMVGGSHKGRFKTFFHEETDSFLKIDFNNGTWLKEETAIMRLGLRLCDSSLNASDINLLVYGDFVETDHGYFKAMISRRFGMNVRSAFLNGVVEISQIPEITNLLVDKVLRIYNERGVFNLDLNPSNVIFYGNDFSNILLIDWIKHYSDPKFPNLSSQTIATSLYKFIKMFLKLGLSLDDFAINDEVTDILAEIEKRNYLN